MNVIMVILATILATSFGFRPVVKVALVALAVSPIPPIVPERALKAGATENYTIGLLAASAAASIVLIPLSMEMLELTLDMPLRMSVLKVAVLAIETVLLPLAIGIALHKLLPALAERVARRSDEIAIVLLLCSVFPIAFIWRHEIMAVIGNGTILAFAAFCAIGLAVGHVIGRPEGENRRVLALSTATRHPWVALAIVEANFPEQRAAPAALIVFVLVNGVATALYLAWRGAWFPFWRPRRHV